MTVSIQDTRAHIYEIQYYLRTIQMVQGITPLINPDGIYGEETIRAVEEFQRRNNLPITGRVDNATWNKIFEEYKKAEEILAPAEGVRVFPLGVIEIKPGDEYDEIYILQVLLKKNEERIKGNSKINISGVYDNETEMAVRELQRIFGSLETGSVDKTFWNKFVKYSNTKYSTDMS